MIDVGTRKVQPALLPEVTILNGLGTVASD